MLSANFDPGKTRGYSRQKARTKLELNLGVNMNFPDQEVESHSAVIRDPELREIADRIGRNLEANAELKRTFVPSAQLPLWPEPARGVPNDILRSALFAAIQGKGREYFKHKLLASYDGVQIRYTGEQLDQSDLDVWGQAIH